MDCFSRQHGHPSQHNARTRFRQGKHGTFFLIDRDGQADSGNLEKPQSLNLEVSSRDGAMFYILFITTKSMS
jgi:hypothetical protein